MLGELGLAHPTTILHNDDSVNRPTIALFRHGELAATTVGAKPRAAIESDLGLIQAAGRTA